MYTKILMLHDNTTNDVITVNTDFLCYAYTNEYGVTSLKLSCLSADENTVLVKESVAKIYSQVDDKFICLHNSDDNSLAIFSIKDFIYSYYDRTNNIGAVVMNIDDDYPCFEVNETPHKICRKIIEKDKKDEETNNDEMKKE